MSAPLFLVDAGSLATATAGGSLVLGGSEGRHAATVRRIAVGESVDVSDGRGVVARCVVTSVGRDELVLQVVSAAALPAPVPRFVLVQALAKGGRDDLAVETATELGVDEIVPWQAERSVVQWRGERGEKARAGWAATARAAAKQSRRPRLPEVSALVTGSGVRLRIEQAALAVVLHEEATSPLAAVALPADGEVLLVVGPEGGISPQELASFTAAGATAYRLGPHVLRSSTAGPAALAVLSALSRWR
ncbi:MAG: 16S rRNA (uracil(1498)-N(3))-methyltransferase [Rhodoferax sp.]|nr:16S rRNA (uracil(1498)-N(3))-methyltransferase [Actinomycetota bacterium]